MKTQLRILEQEGVVRYLRADGYDNCVWGFRVLEVLLHPDPVCFPPPRRPQPFLPRVCPSSIGLVPFPGVFISVLACHSLCIYLPLKVLKASSSRARAHTLTHTHTQVKDPLRFNTSFRDMVPLGRDKVSVHARTHGLVHVYTYGPAKRLQALKRLQGFLAGCTKKLCPVICAVLSKSPLLS